MVVIVKPNRYYPNSHNNTIQINNNILFLVTVYAKSEGRARAKQFYDLSLVRTVLSLGASFGCEEHKVCSDFHMWLPPGTPVNDGTKKWKGTWYDSPLHTQVWKAIHTQDL